MLLDPNSPFEYHVFEFKASRADLARELRDPRKIKSFDDDCTFLWILANSSDILTADLRRQIKALGLGCAYAQGQQVFQTHQPRVPPFSDWYLLHENVRRRALGQTNRASSTEMRAYFGERQWFPDPPRVARLLRE
jgi:hypothetical protein